jgi:hypothetical protein
MCAAEGLTGGAGSELQTVHESLSELDGELASLACEQQDLVAETMRSIINNEVANHGKVVANEAQSENVPEDELAVQHGPSCKIREELLQLFKRSPLGVLRAVEPPVIETSSPGLAANDQIRSLVLERVASMLPEEFQRFRQATHAERALQLA